MLPPGRNRRKAMTLPSIGPYLKRRRNKTGPSAIAYSGQSRRSADFHGTRRAVLRVGPPPRPEEGRLDAVVPSVLGGSTTTSVAARPGVAGARPRVTFMRLSLIHISEPTRLGMISYAVFCLKK